MRQLLKLGLIGVLATIILNGLLTAPAGAAVKSNTWVNDNLEYGISTAYDWDKSCRDALRSTNPRIHDATFQRLAGDPYPEALRHYFNEGVGPWQAISYRSQNWMSLAGKGNITTPIVVTEGDETIDFQANYVMFLCGNLVSPDRTANCTSGLRSVTGTSLANDTVRWVTPTNSNDRAPNPMGSSCMMPTRTGNVTQFLNVQVFEENASGGWDHRQTIPINAQRLVTRDNASRYWYMNPVSNITYNRPGGFTEPTKLRFVMTTKTGAIYENERLTYYRDNGQRVQILCTVLSCVPWSDFGTSEYVSILPITVNALPRLNPSASITPKPVMIGGTVTGQHTVVNTSAATSLSASVTRGFFHDVNGNNLLDSGEPTYGTVTSTDAVAGGATRTYLNTSLVATAANFPGNGMVCAFTLVDSVTPGFAGTPNPATDCTSMGKIPKLHVRNGDLVVGGGTAVNDCQVQRDSIYLQGVDSHPGPYGATTAEYGILALGNMSGFGSQGIGTGSGATPTAASTRLTFANTPTLGNFRGEAAIVQNCLNDPFDTDYFKDRITLQSLEAAGQPLPSMVTRKGSVYEIGNVELQPGDNFILYSSGTSIDIVGNITYRDSGYTSLSQLPRFAILTNGAIYIAPNVTSLYGVYATNNRFMTCFPAGVKQVSTTDCDQPLTVNGPVYTGPGSGMGTWRTFGGTDTTADQPAELFNLHPAVIMSEYETPGRQLETIIHEELPPRF